MILEYIITAITILAVAVPEGLPLAVTLALTFSSNKMMQEQVPRPHAPSVTALTSATSNTHRQPP